ncbi:hypothetical protein ACFY2H_36005 [Streptomyces griseofuscus]|uniref:hypothetical protein n=1 Tax=Streptomyces griseofuscus TaxID=146922 RepID=UPI0036B972A1
MTAHHPRAVLLLAAAVPLAATTAATVLRAGHWGLYADRHRIELKPPAPPLLPRLPGGGRLVSRRREPGDGDERLLGEPAREAHPARACPGLAGRTPF